MARVPVVRHKGVVRIASDVCIRCIGGHLMSDHDEDKTRQCNKCMCVAQDTN